MTDETTLRNALQRGEICPIYFFFGDEPFLTGTYSDRVKSKVVGNDPDDFNFIVMKDNPSSSVLADNVESLPLFADKKMIMIRELNPEKLDSSELGRYIEILSDIPDTVVIVISITDTEIQLKKSATKTLLATIEKNGGCVCEFKPMSIMKIGDLITKKVSKQKRIISHTNAEYIAEITLCDLTLASKETEKLCCYTAEGEEITRESIDKLVVKQLDTKIYALTDLISSGRKQEALSVLDELFEQRVEPIIIVASLAGTFVNLYHAKIAKNQGISPQKAAADFGCPPNRAWLFSKAYNSVARTDIEYYRNSISLLAEADVKMKSTFINNRVLIEQTIIALMVTK